MKPLYVLCDPRKADGFVNAELDARLQRSRYSVIYTERDTDKLRGKRGALVIRGPYGHYQPDPILWPLLEAMQIEVIEPTDPRVPGLIEEARA